jgi:cell division transport system permease protein
MTRVLTRLVWVVAGVLALAVVLVVGNTIRLQIQGRRAEIEVAKLVGATDAFVRRPFLYRGLWYGLGGALVAWLVVAAGLALLAGPVDRLAALYFSGFELRGLTTRQVAGLALAGAGLGLGGSWVAVGRHLGAVQPR